MFILALNKDDQKCIIEVGSSGTTLGDEELFHKKLKADFSPAF